MHLNCPIIGGGAGGLAMTFEFNELKNKVIEEVKTGEMREENKHTFVRKGLNLHGVCSNQKCLA